MYEKGCWRRVSVGRRADGRSPRATRRHDAPSRARASTMTDDTRARLLADARDATRDADRATARRRAARRRAETSLTTFVLEAFARASPIALGVVAARLTSDVLDAFVDAFVSPSVALMLGSTSRDLEAMSFRARGVEFRYGALAERIVDACLTLALIYLAMRGAARLRIAGAPVWTPSARCALCKSWVPADARVCASCGGRRATADDDDDDDDEDS